MSSELIQVTVVPAVTASFSGLKRNPEIETASADRFAPPSDPPHAPSAAMSANPATSASLVRLLFMPTSFTGRSWRAGLRFDETWTVMPNRLADATSPYLLQHAHNPVAWQEWGPEALEEAKRRDVPILLSIGYAACHWCHVMERESFEDEKTAAIMNEWFVPVKVDREERPDLDAVYMDAVQAMTGQGGWPMTVFLSPDGRPFYGGTYFPPEDRHGMPAFGRVMGRCTTRGRTGGKSFSNKGRRCCNTSSARPSFRARRRPSPRTRLRRAVEVLSRSFDSEWGGFGAAPKFPQPMTLDFLLRMHAARHPGGAGYGEANADQDGARRDLRSGRRRFPPVLGRPRLARAAFREDALRQRPTAPPVHARVGRSPRTGSTAKRRWRPPTTCYARCAIRRAASTPRRTPTPKGSKASSTCGRSTS